ncbi:MAG: hypothetical protein KKC43_05795 [Alphaproteobacteria bacterium]|nr:hypothetical protein [Alphaproteobacteria bacterium]
MVIEPLVTANAKARLIAGRIGGTGWVALAQLGSRILLLASLSSALALGLAAWINAQDNLGMAETNALLDHIGAARDQLAEIGTAWGAGATVLIAVGLGLLTFLASKAKEKRVVAEVWNAEFTRLQTSFDNGEWDERAPSPEMEQVQRTMEELSEAFDTAQAQGEGQRAAAIRGAFDKLAQANVFLDLQRRSNVQVAPESVGIKPKRSGLSWISAMFFSKGVVSGLGTGTRFLASAGLLILFPSLLAASYTAVEPALQASVDRIETRRAEMEFEIEFAEIDRSYSELVGAPADAADERLDDDTELAITQTAEVFETEIFPRMLVRSIQVSGAGLDDAVRSVETASARQRILGIRASAARGAPATVSGGIDAPDYRSLSSAEVPGSGTTRAELRRVAQSDPAGFTRLRDNVRALKLSFTTPADASQLRSALVSQIVGHALDAAPALEGLDPALDRQIKTWAAEIPSAEAARAREVILKKFVVESQAQGELDWSRLADWHHSPLSPSTSRSIGNALSEFERSLPQGSRLADNLPSLSRAPRYNPAQASQAVSQMAGHLGSGSGSAAFPARALTVFDDHFPGQVGAELSTPQAKAIQSISGAPPAPAVRSTAAAAKASTRARSYGRLRGFSRIGGVLIGREPEDAETSLAIDHFSWRRSGGRIELVLGAGSDRQSIGRFNPAIVQLALAYAADGRPTTVTMVTTDVVPDLRILLHPVLEDTGLGCRAIRLDQLADELSFTEGSALTAIRTDAEQRIRGEVGLYRLAWRARAQTKLPGSSLSGDDRDYAQQAISQAEYVPELERIAAEAISGALAAPLWIRRKPAFLDPSLVTQMEACLPSRSLGQFETCISTITDKVSSRTDRYAWLAPPPDYQIWSGVRERPYEISSNLDFLRPPGDSSVWPFRFMVQVAFESPAFFAGGASKWADEINAARDEYVDDDPWEIETVSRSLTEAIEAEVRRNVQTSDVISNMREFAILQRLFRTALDGRLGPDFPTDQLVELSQQTAKDVNPDALTAQWLRRPGEIEGQLFARTAALAETIPAGFAEDQFFSHVGDCMALIMDTVENNPRGEVALESIAASRWSKVCVFSNLSTFGSGSSAGDLQEFSRIAADIRNVRAAVGATKPDLPEYPSERGACPRL